MNNINRIIFTVFVIFGIFMFFKNNVLEKNRYINTIVRGCARWAAASLQDKSPIVSVLHGNYAAGYLWALRDVFSDIEIMNASGIDIIKFQKKITDVQDRATQILIKTCPQYASDIDIYLGRIGGEHV